MLQEKLPIIRFKHPFPALERVCYGHRSQLQESPYVIICYILIVVGVNFILDNVLEAFFWTYITYYTVQLDNLVLEFLGKRGSPGYVTN